MIKGKFEDLTQLIGLESFDKVAYFIAQLKLGSIGANQWVYFDHQQYFKAIGLATSNLNDSVKEYHKKFSDIHILIKGSDDIFLGENVLEVVEPYQEALDYSLVKATTSGIINIIPGDFVIIEPEEIHCNVIAENSLKLVVKIIRKWQK